MLSPPAFPSPPPTAPALPAPCLPRSLGLTGLGPPFFRAPPPGPLLFSLFFPVVLLGPLACPVGLAVLAPSLLGAPAAPLPLLWPSSPPGPSFPSSPPPSRPPSVLGCSLPGFRSTGGFLPVPKFLAPVPPFPTPFRRPVAPPVFFARKAAALWFGPWGPTSLLLPLSLSAFFRCFARALLRVCLSGLVPSPVPSPSLHLFPFLTLIPSGSRAASSGFPRPFLLFFLSPPLPTLRLALKLILRLINCKMLLSPVQYLFLPLLCADVPFS
ncbi:cytochrome b6/f complex subunit IV plastid [Cinnamomum micranthum f. kanehirae]|uniref:Cytochrome b6/f complex subunit IV plastid n=1 Tax=Cinnamomum micranthum f. kanehirae TaxID=337451 RepID=A0A443Q599_9MAGN|nr:cytochrome b6/f complex subunit IV plastid [Cinnamomum micranthum f. kanehirae]